MTDKKEPGMAFDIGKLNKVFAFLSVLFLITTIWVFLDDYIRPWKKVQIDGLKIKRARIQEQIAEFNKNLDPKKLKEMEDALAAGKKASEDRKNQIKEVKKSLDEVHKKIKAQTIVNGDYNSQASALTFEYEVEKAHKTAKADQLFLELKKYKALFAESRDLLKKLKSNESELIKEIEKFESEQLSAEALEKELIGKRDLLKIAENKTAMDPVFFLRNAPLLDFLDPTIKIQQIVLKNITDDRYFQAVPKVDRCTTCHMFIDQPGYEKQNNPYRTHPKLDLMLGANSPHPIKQIGCTVCHGGEGHRVNDFNSVAHVPQNSKQQKEWEEKYHWHAPHKVPKAMLPLQYTEGACLTCHKGADFVPRGNVVNSGIKLIQKYGCYACHKIEGWENRRVPGPSLERIAAKVDKEFFKNWVWNPKDFNQHARMPSFFNQENNKRHDFQKLNIAEVNAIAEYLFEKSKPYRPDIHYSGGDKEKGKALIKEVGCLGCHGVAGLEEESKKVNAGAAPYLSGTGSKVSGDWLVTWLKKPSHYQPNTIMPSFRLSDDEANNIAAYLLSLKNEAFSKLRFEPLIKADRDQILLDYLSSFDTKEVAKQKLAAMSDRERTLDLGYRSVGKYGCYSCHNIEGFAGRAPIGPELTKVGSKPIEQFAFSHEIVDHNRHSWIVAHLQNPRRWDNGTDKSFDEILRMPNFNMNKKDAELITGVLLGLTSEVVPLNGMKVLDEYEKTYAKGMQVVNKFNCIGCHQIDGEHGDILAMFDDVNEGPPRLINEGHRVQNDWFNHFLQDVHPIRPFVKVRMPSFNMTNAERNAIVTGFQAKAKQMTYDDNLADVVWETGEREAANKLWDALACVSCHSIGFTKTDPMAPNLHLSRRRLRASWIKEWLLDPQKVMPGTTMPSFWQDGVATEAQILDGNVEKQINALTKLILDFGDKDFPKK